jgi:hypothetical protein
MTLERVLLSNPMGDMGDRNIIGGTTFIQSDQWHIEADIHMGTIRDAHVYRNTNVNTRSAEPNWQWYAAIPAGNIKAYRIANYNQPPQSLSAEPQATTSQKATTVASAKALG